jgi:hypothetical protein
MPFGFMSLAPESLRRDSITLGLVCLGISSCGKAVMRSLAAAYEISVIVSSGSLLLTGLCEREENEA